MPLESSFDGEKQDSYILAIDPGTTYSGFVLINTETLEPVEFGKIQNDELEETVSSTEAGTVVIERIASYGMPVGRSVFETCEEIGRLSHIAETQGKEVQYVYRKEEKKTICGTYKANDTTIRRALIQRFAKHDFERGKGTKGHKDWFYGFKSDVWQAYAVGITYLDRENSG